MMLKKILSSSTERKLLLGNFVMLAGISMALMMVLVFGSDLRQVPALVQSNRIQFCSQIKEMREDVQSLNVEIKQSNDIPASQLKMIAEKLNAIQNSLVTIGNQTSSQQLATLLANNNKLLIKQLNETKNTAAKRERKLATHRVRARLPFQVVSIDVWNGSPQATVECRYGSDLMTIGDNTVGWTLVGLSFSDGWAVFKNQYNQAVRVRV